LSAPLTTLPPALERARRPAALIGLVGSAAAVVGLFTAPRQFYLSYLFAYMFWLALPLGGLAVLMLQHVTGGAWGFLLRRPLECAAQLVPLMAVLFLPIAFGMEHLYPWAAESPGAGLHASELREIYLTRGFFLARAAAYFALWSLLAYLLARWSRAEDAAPDPRLLRRFRVTSGPGMVLYGFSMTFASVDWVMSLSPRWHSTLFGMLFVAGQTLESFALAICVLLLLADKPPLSEILRPEHLIDLGNLLLAFVMIWAYLAFSQYLIVWSADLSAEIPHYLYRTAGGWEWLALFLVVFHFFVPFLILLNREAKRRRGALLWVAAALLLVHALDVFWVVVPSYAQGHEVLPVPGIRVHWLDLAAFCGLGGLWAAAFIRQIQRWPAVPMGDPRLAELRHGE